MNKGGWNRFPQHLPDTNLIWDDNPSADDDPDNEGHENAGERIKTTHGIAIICLNPSISPPGVYKPVIAPTLYTWMVPSEDKKNDAIGERLQQQYLQLQPKLRLTALLDPTIDETLKVLMKMSSRKSSRRLLIHYNGNGMPVITNEGELWLFNGTFTQYIPLPLTQMLSTLNQSPTLWVVDSPWAQRLVPMLSKEPGALFLGAGPGYPVELGLHTMPVDLYTSILTTPVRTALHYFHQSNQWTHSTEEDQKLLWILTAITDTIAWELLPAPLFRMLFREDVLVAALFRNHFLALRMIVWKGAGGRLGIPVSLPPLPVDAIVRHVLWDEWENILAMTASGNPALLFFPAHLQELHVWIKMMRYERAAMVSKYLTAIFPPFAIYNEEPSQKQRWVLGGIPAVPPPPPAAQPLVPTGWLARRLMAIETAHPRPFIVPLLNKPPSFGHICLTDGRRRDSLPILLQALLSPQLRPEALQHISEYIAISDRTTKETIAVGLLPFISRLTTAAMNNDSEACFIPSLAVIWAHFAKIEKRLFPPLIFSFVIKVRSQNNAEAAAYTSFILFILVTMPSNVHMDIDQYLDGWEHHQNLWVHFWLLMGSIYCSKPSTIHAERLLKILRDNKPLAFLLKAIIKRTLELAGVSWSMEDDASLAADSSLPVDSEGLARLYTAPLRPLAVLAADCMFHRLPLSPSVLRRAIE